MLFFSLVVMGLTRLVFPAGFEFSIEHLALAVIHRWLVLVSNAHDTRNAMDWGGARGSHMMSGSTFRFFVCCHRQLRSEIPFFAPTQDVLYGDIFSMKHSHIGS